MRRRRTELVSLYLGQDRSAWPFPAPICYLILSFSGICQAGRRQSYFFFLVLCL